MPILWIFTPATPKYALYFHWFRDNQFFSIFVFRAPGKPSIFLMIIAVSDRRGRHGTARMGPCHETHKKPTFWTPFPAQNSATFYRATAKTSIFDYVFHCFENTFPTRDARERTPKPSNFDWFSHCFGKRVSRKCDFAIRACFPLVCDALF